MQMRVSHAWCCRSMAHGAEAIDGEPEIRTLEIEDNREGEN